MAVNINFETLFEFLRNEKKRDELQKLDSNFFESLLSYLIEKKKLLEQQQSKVDIFSVTERAKTERQLTSVLQIIKELYERREKKIINMAINKVRTGSGLIDTSALLKEEQSFYNDMVEILSRYKKGLLSNLLSCRQPNVEVAEKKEVKEKKKEGKEDKKDNKKELSKDEKDESVSPISNKDEILVRFISPIPKFYGPELEVYGPFDEEDMAKLPRKVAEVLINKARAEEIKDSSD
ncbi:hypothetical protein DRJ17_00285 [Candidatus Woesearchaeota archaeon]|nr:MAG: hypothetical protein DRJ17_00285 [Candidatus Woesearchaeota archaeon]